MVSDWSHCLYCSRAYPPATPSREHVLQESLGGRMILPGAVCQRCNHSLNRDVDQKLKEMFRAVLVYLDIHSRKRRGTRGVTVERQSSAGPVRGIMRADGHFETPPKVRRRTSRQPVARGTLVHEEWDVGTREAAIQLFREREAAFDALNVEAIEVSLGPSATTSLSGSGETLVRAAAKASINYLAFRRPADAQSGLLLDAKGYVLRGHSSGVQLTATGPAALFDPKTNLTQDLWQPTHRVAVGAETGGPLRGGILLFGAVWIHVVLSEDWLGERFHAEVEFYAGAGTSNRIDRGFIHPQEFRLVTPGEARGELLVTREVS